MSPPAGGPEDKVPPKVVRVTPDTNAVNVADRAATFYFDEIINNRGEGPADISNYFLVSPSDGEPRVSWHRTRIDVRPRHGFRPNTAYTITLLPGLTDLRSNAMKTTSTVVFSTGPTIPPLRINGTAFDWVAERVAPDALIQAVTSDSITYLAKADTGGHFVIGPLGPGTYLVRGFIDQNQNRALDRTESWDSVRVTTPQTAPAELLLASRDTLPARLLSVSPIDSVTLRLTFDRLLDPTQTFPVANVRLVGADSTPIPIAATRTPREETERDKAVQKAAADSARRADSLAGRPLAPIPSAAPAPAGAKAPPEPAKPSRPAPFTTITIVTAQPLKPNTNYRVSVTAVRALSGRVSGSERQFTTPKPPPPRPPSDSAAAPGSAPTNAPANAPAPLPSAVPPLPTTRPAAPPAGAPPSRP
ncbi:MAG TPA: Ig-like domain-containing protein [Gemmatimonadaceae bacterium]|nr:Ig-like domain-containing protein [Gemmatimonadaceae bacterium]